MKAWILLLVACSSPQRTEPLQATAVGGDAAISIDAAPDAQLQDAMALLAPDAAPTVVVVTTDECGLVLQPIFFAEGTTKLTPAQKAVAEDATELIACIIRTENTIVKFEVAGHTDDKERDPLRLSEERAVVIANMLADKGVPAKMMHVVGYGNAQPIDKKKTAQARARNRRVDFLMLERKSD